MLTVMVRVLVDAPNELTALPCRMPSLIVVSPV